MATMALTEAHVVRHHSGRRGGSREKKYFWSRIVKKRIRGVSVPLLAFLASVPALPAQDEPAEWPSPRLDLAAAARSGPGAGDPDAVTLRDGSYLKGEVLTLENNVLRFVTGRGEKLEINWAHVVALRSSKRLTLVMSDGSRHSGTVRPGDLRGSLWVRTGTGEEVNLPIRLVRLIDPPPDRIRAKGALTLGASMAQGNSETTNFSFLWDAEVKNRLNRLGTTGSWIYSEDEEEITAKRFEADVQYDRFVMDRVYGYVASRFEKDPFKDLDLRTVPGIGLGYQATMEGDMPGEFMSGPFLKDVQWLNTLDLRGEGGISYFIDNYYDAPNRSYLSARWSVKMRWPVHERIYIFHRHEGYPSLEDIENLFISTQQGIRLQLVGGFFVTFQVNWDWHNMPSPGLERNDFVFITGIGYNFDLWE